ncbi:MAG: hypothetical protein AAFV77_12550, partial [Planctomycetota bacterium]
MSKPQRKRSALPRRFKVVWLAITFLLANAVSASFLIALADRYRVRLDVTATGEHRLADQTLRLIEAIDPGEGFELVVAADTNRVDPRAWQALMDVGDEMKEQGAVTLTALDGASAREGLQALARRLSDREATEIQGQSQTLLRIAMQLDQSADSIDRVVVSALAAAAEAAEDDQIRAVMAARSRNGPRLAEDLRGIA